MTEKRTKKLTVRMTEDEWKHAQALAKRTNRPLAVLMREWAIGKEKELSCHHRPTTIIHSADPELLRNIAKIGGNINQIAKHLNTLNRTGELSSSEFLDSLVILKAMEDELSLLVEAFTYDD